MNVAVECNDDIITVPNQRLFGLLLTKRGMADTKEESWPKILPLPVLTAMG